VTSPDGRRVAAAWSPGGEVGEVLVLDAVDGRVLGSAAAPHGPRLTWSSDGSSLAVGGGSAVAVYDLGPDGAFSRRHPSRHAYAVRSLVASPEGERLLAVDEGGLVLEWDVSAGTSEVVGVHGAPAAFAGRQAAARGAARTREQPRHERWIEVHVGARTVKLPRAPDAFAVRGDGGVVARSGRHVVVVDGGGKVTSRVGSLPRALSRDGAVVVEVTDPNLEPNPAYERMFIRGDDARGLTIALLDPATGQVRVPLELPPAANACAFSADDRQVVCAGADGLAVADRATGTAVARLGWGGPRPHTIHEASTGVEGIGALSLRDGVLAVLGFEHLEVFEVATGVELLDVTWTEPAITAAEVLPGQLALGDAWGRIHLVPLER
jgi:hypothetical protein